MKVACGRDNSAFVTDEGFLFTMGSNKHGKLGLNLSYEECKGVSQPVLVTELSSSPVTDVSLGKRHSLVACHNQTVYSWGKSFDETGSCLIKPEMIFQGLGLERLRVQCGPQQSAVIAGDRIFVAGLNTQYCLLDEVESSVREFSEIPLPLARPSSGHLDVLLTGTETLIL